MLRRRFPRTAYSIRPHNITFPATGAIKYLLVLRSLIDFLCILSALSGKTNLRNKREGMGTFWNKRGSTFSLDGRSQEEKREGRDAMWYGAFKEANLSRIRDGWEAILHSHGQSWAQWAPEFCSDWACFYFALWFSSQLSCVFFTWHPFYGSASLPELRFLHLIIKCHSSLFAGHCIFYIEQFTWWKCLCANALKLQS